MTKPRLATLLAAAAVLAGHAAAAVPQRPEPTQAELKERLAAVLAEPFTENTAWITDYAAAREAAARSGKPIFAYFTRSYAP